MYSIGIDPQHRLEGCPFTSVAVRRGGDCLGECIPGCTISLKCGFPPPHLEMTKRRVSQVRDLFRWRDPSDERFLAVVLVHSGRWNTCSQVLREHSATTSARSDNDGEMASALLLWHKTLSLRSVAHLGICDSVEQYQKPLFKQLNRE